MSCVFPIMRWLEFTVPLEQFDRNENERIGRFWMRKLSKPTTGRNALL